ncbi:MAG: tRNA dihydrouridine synthase DusB [Simkaniaceae bacterium]
MNSYHQPIQIGSLSLKSNVFYAPLAGCSDYPFRQMSNHCRPGLFFTEMVKMDALIRYDQSTFRLLDYDGSMHPIGGQLVGSKSEIAGKAAKIIEELGFDLIDLNCGCPVDKVTKDGSGSGLLKTPQKIGEILSNMINAVSIPVTLKIRIGWDENAINAAQITKIAEKAGASAITIHGRTRAQGYKGSADLNPILEAKKEANKIMVIGNGDIFSGEDAEKMFEYTGCDGILVARGSLGTPWIHEDIVRHLNRLEPINRSPQFIKETLLNHLSLILSYQPKRRALLDLRRISCWYFKKGTGTKKLRESLCRISDLKEAYKIIEKHEFPV